ncbi:MAG: type II toxin-antitoxin system RelE/ParE family toxin [Candidatus Omnitrophica bacterium]|nr:type II toxin-antitoxin system RelE/ParE family toxin [Candidatus Omnitrophota bacterium]
MGKFTVLLQSQPEKHYKKANRKIAEALEICFKELEENPFFLPGRIKKLRGYKGLYRYRLGGWRVVYEVSLEKHTVGVIAILPRGDVYKRF